VRFIEDYFPKGLFTAENPYHNFHYQKKASVFSKPSTAFILPEDSSNAIQESENQEMIQQDIENQAILQEVNLENAQEIVQENTEQHLKDEISKGEEDEDDHNKEDTDAIVDKMDVDES